MGGLRKARIRLIARGHIDPATNKLTDAGNAAAVDLIARLKREVPDSVPRTPAIVWKTR